jgi:hypothetical protein
VTLEEFWRFVERSGGSRSDPTARADWLVGLVHETFERAVWLQQIAKLGLYRTLPPPAWMNQQ